MNAQKNRLKNRLLALGVLVAGLTLLLLLSGVLPDGIAQSLPSEGGEQERDIYLMNEEPVTLFSEPPVAAKITVGHPDQVGFTVITGTAGAVVPDALVAVSNLETMITEFVQAEGDGSFSVTLLAPAGTYVQIKHAQMNVPTIAEIIGSGGFELAYGWLTGSPGTVLPVPLNHTGSGGSIPFGLAGLVSDQGEGYWTFAGTMGPEVISGTEMVYPISGTLVVHTPAITSGIDLGSLDAVTWFYLRRLFDPNGRQVAIHQQFISDMMAPTGLPISRETPNWSPIHELEPVVGWQLSGDHSVRAPISMTLVVPAGTQPGYYRPRFGVYCRNMPLGPMNSNLYIMRVAFQYGTGYLPIIQVGEPDSPRLLWTLLTDTLYQGTRGTVAREDKASYGVTSLTVFQSDVFVVPRVDPRTGEPLTYTLEPYLPLVAISDRGVPNPPLVPFLFPGGQLQVEVRKPDDSVDTLGPAPFQQSTSRGPAFTDGALRDNDGHALHDVYQLTTLDDQFAYTFEQYGHHVITMSGTIEDVWGNIYQGTATFDVFVARPLRIETGQLPATPYVMDNALSPGLQVYPPVPAHVAVHLTHLINSDPTQAITHTIVGQANRFGYFQPPAGTAILFDGPGEYRIDVSAIYTDTEGTLWMGHLTWGNAVEGDSPVLIAHGHRGLDIPHWNNLLWFFHLTQLDLPVIAAHTYYPYYSGDIFWGGETADYVDTAGDSIAPILTFQDTVGDIYQIVEQRWYSGTHVKVPLYETLSERLTVHEAPLVSTTSDGSDPHWAPEKIDQYAYAYRTSQRPGARVHENISEEGTVYWRFNANYGDQVGREGDLLNDIKWEFGGAVFRVISETNPINEYAIYGSLWVLIDGDDPLGPRVTPPFQGAASGPNGGPIMTLKGQEIDLFFYPRCVQPGDTLEAGDTFAFCGHVGPPLNSNVAVTVTTPGSEVASFGGQANKVGWYYNPGHDFVVDEPGVWTVQVHVAHNEVVPSTGLAPSTHNTGGVLGSLDGRYHFYVVEKDSSRLSVVSPQPGYLTWPTDPVTLRPITVTAVPITVSIPSGLTNVVVSYTVRMPGFILEEGTFTPSGNTFTITYDPLALHQDFPNLDLIAKDANQPGLADPVLIAFLLSGEKDGQEVHRAGAVFLNGEEVQMPETTVNHFVYLPLILRDE